MFKSVDIINFQSHLDTHIEFDEGVNLIVGDSDCGKSAIIRAMNWVISNRPLGDGFLRDGSDNTLVHLKTDSGFVERCKGQENVYSLNGNTFEAFGSSVPKEIVDFLNLSDVNVQGQLSPYFLVLETSGYIGTYLREVCKLDKLDLLYADLTKKLNQCMNEDTRYDDESFSITTNYIASIEFGERLDVLEFDVAEYEKAEVKRNELDVSKQTLANLISSLESVEKSIKVVPDDIENGITLLLDCVAHLEAITATKTGLDAVVRGMSSLSFVAVPTEFSKWFDEFETASKAISTYDNDILSLVDTIKHITNSDVKYLSNIQDIHSKELALLNLYNKLDVCPTCERFIDAGCLDTVINNLKGLA